MALWDNPPYYITAYGLAVKHGYTGTEEQWIESLRGKSAYDLAKEGGYEGTQEEFYATLANFPAYAAAAAEAEQNAETAQQAADSAWTAKTSAENAATAAASNAAAAAGSAQSMGSSVAAAAASAAAAAEAATRANAAKLAAEQVAVDVEERIEETIESLDTEAVLASVEELREDMENLDIGMSFDSGYQDADGYIHLTRDGEDLPADEFTPFQVSGGGSGGGGDTGSRITFSVNTPTSFSVLDTAGGTAEINFTWSSVDTESGQATGNGYLEITVGSTVKSNVSIQQGTRSADVFQWLNSGSNTVKLKITDAYGTVKSRTFTISKESFGLSWSLNAVQRNTADSLSFYLTPTGTGEKTIYVKVDGVLFSTDSVSTSGRRLTKTVSGLTHGAHSIEAYGVMTVGGADIESEHLYATVAQTVTGNTTPIVAVSWPTGSLQQFTTVQIPYLVVDPENNPATAVLSVDGNTISTVSADQAAQIWSYRPSTAGTVTLGIACGLTSETETLTVDAIAEDVSEVTDGLEIKVDPAEIANLSAWRGGANNEYRFTLSENFDQVNGGVTTDSSGAPCIRVTAGDRLRLNYKPFNREIRSSGLELKIVYAIRDCSLKNTVGISCATNDEIGLIISANNVQAGGDQTSVTLSTCEDEKTELDVNIQRRAGNALICLYEKCSTFSIDQYAAESENFSHAGEIVIGSDDADVYLYLLRGYSRDLTDEEIRTNYIADGASGTEILNRRNSNAIYDGQGKISVDLVRRLNPKAHIIILHIPRMTETKRDGVVGTLEHYYEEGGALHRFRANVTIKVQGTSSQGYVKFAGANLNMSLSDIFLLDENGTATDTELTDGYAMNGTENSIPTKELTWKKNVASQEHVINRTCAEWYNRYQPSVRPARENDSRIRDCLESAMCAVFVHNTSDERVQIWPDWVEPDETVFYGLGNLCSNKDATEVFAYDPIVIEVKDNITDQQLWKSDDLSGDNFDASFEFRYLDEEQYTEAQAKALFQNLLSFVVETDYTEATDEALAEDVTINGQVFRSDTAAYRKAKWKAECANYFDMDTLYWHTNITLFFLLRDNRAKNMFWSYSATQHKWGLWFNWDNDTGLCRDNNGFIDIEPGYLDTDQVGTAYVYNGARSALFSSLRENNAAELRANYLAMESAGAWNRTAIYNYLEQSQETFCEALWMEDAEHNAIRVLENLSTTAYLKRATGRLRLHLKKALMFQKALIDSYYISGAAESDRVIMSAYTPENWQNISSVEPSGAITITPYTDIFVTVNDGSGNPARNHTQRAQAGQPVTLTLTDTLNDTKVWIYSAEWIQAIGDLSPLYLGELNASALKRVKTLLPGSSTPGYVNTQLHTFDVSNCKKLEELNLSGMQGASFALNLTGNLYLKELDTRGSAITGVTFAKNGRLETARLNDPTTLVMKGLIFLSTFTMEDYSKLRALTIEDCLQTAAGSYAIARQATGLTSVRMLGIDWLVPASAYNVLNRLYGIAGIDDEGYSSEAHGVVRGDVEFASIGQTRYNDIVSKFEDVDFTYDEFATEYTVTFTDGQGNTLGTPQRVEAGGAALDPVSSGLVQTPTKPSSTEKVYTFNGWSQTFGYVTQDLTVDAVYSETDRYYTVNFLDGEGQVAESHSVIAHGSCSYEGGVITASGRIWDGWVQSTDDVTTDMNVEPSFITPVIPSAVQDMTQFDFAYSDLATDNAAYSKAEFAGILLTRRASSYFAEGDRIRMVTDTDVIADESIIFQLIGFDHFRRTDDNTQFANTVWHSIGLLNAYRRMNPTNDNTGSWPASEMRDWLNNTLFPALPPFWRSIIAQVQVLSSAGNMSGSIVSSSDHLFLLSQAEVGFNAGDVPYTDEVDSGAAAKTFGVFTDNNSRIRKTFNGAGTANNWWLRSPYPSDATYFMYVHSNGNSYSYPASSTHGVAPGFCI